MQDAAAGRVGAADKYCVKAVLDCFSESAAWMKTGFCKVAKSRRAWRSMNFGTLAAEIARCA